MVLGSLCESVIQPLRGGVATHRLRTAVLEGPRETPGASVYV